MVDAHGLPKLELHSAPSLPPADLVCPALPCSLCQGMHAGNWATSPLLTPLEWACLENNTHLAGLIPKQVTNKLNNLSSHSSAFFFPSFFSVSYAPTFSLHTHNSDYKYIPLVFLNFQLLSCYLSHILLVPYFILLLFLFSLYISSYTTMLSKYSCDDPETITRSSINRSCSPRSYTTFH